MKRYKKAAGILLLVLIAAAAAAGIRQKDNIAALIKGAASRPDEIEAQLDAGREALKSQIEKYTSKPVTDISAEDEKKLLEGELSLDEISDKYGLPEETSGNRETVQQESPGGSGETAGTEDRTKAVDEAVSTGVAKMYALKAKYVSKIGELERSVYSRYSALPKEERTSKAKKKIVADSMEYVLQMEKDCDSQVEKVLSDLEEQLAELGEDTEVVKILKKAYNDEKALKKSYYLSLLREHGL